MIHVLLPYATAAAGKWLELCPKLAEAYATFDVHLYDGSSVLLTVGPTRESLERKR